MSPVTLSRMAAAKLSTSGQSVCPSASWPWEPLAACQRWGLSLGRAHKSATAQLSLSALCEAAEEAVVFSAAGCTNVTLIIS